jgi:hypothetical protein
LILFIHAAPVSLAATQAALERRPAMPNVRHALVPGLVDPRAMTFAEDEADYARIRRAAFAHLHGDEVRVVLSCSVYNGFAPRLAHELGLPVERSDDAGARAAIARATRVGLAVSYPPSYAIVERHLVALARAHGHGLEIVPLLAENAVAFADDPPRYARSLLDATRTTKDIDAILLAQYSMDPLAPLIGEAVAIPVVSALEETLARL